MLYLSLRAINPKLSPYITGESRVSGRIAEHICLGGSPPGGSRVVEREEDLFLEPRGLSHGREKCRLNFLGLLRMELGPEREV